MTSPKIGRRAAMAGALLTSGGLIAASTPAMAQPAPSSARSALSGCWEPVGAPTDAERLLCVVPAAGGAAGLDLATVDSGRVVARTRVTPGGERRTVSRDECTGWESAQAAPGGERVYLRAEYRCPGGLTRGSSALLTVNAAGELLDIQGAGAGEGRAVRVGRYRPATGVVPAELGVVAARDGGLAVSTARMAAAAPLAQAEIVEASRAVDASVVEAWLVERGERFTLDGERLVALADAGVPERVIDMMVALSYPKRFAVNPASREGDFRPTQPANSEAIAGTSGRRVYADMFGSSPYGWNAFSPFGASLFGLGYGGYGNRYGYGWYPGGAPVIVVRGQDGSTTPAVARGRAVNGRGYTRDGDGGGSGATPRTSIGSSGSSGSGSSGSSGAASGGSSGNSGSGSGRTAKPRPQ